MVDKILRIKDLCGRPRQRPRRLYADRGYDYDCYRRQLRAKGITPVIARRGVGQGSGLGTRRWVVGADHRPAALVPPPTHHWEIRDNIHEALLTLACAIVYWR